MYLALRGREAMCPLCSRVFTSDAMCEKHKQYREAGTRRGHTFTVARCVDPSTLGMTAKTPTVQGTDRPKEVWTLPVPEASQWWSNTQATPKPTTQTLTCTRCNATWTRTPQRGRPPRFCADCASTN